MQVSFQQWGNPHSQQQILMIHGWGMNSSVWSDSAARLERAYPEHLIRAVDLPGYGYSAGYELDHYTAHALAGSLLPLLEDKHTTIIAWSMGGLVALDLLCEPNVAIERLILVSSTPRFVQATNWGNAVEAQVFESFCQSLSEDHEATLERFLAIQALGSRTAREDIKTLQRQLFKRGKPDLNALKKGLELLLNEDKRAQLSGSTKVPIHLIVGKLDTLVKYKGQQLLAQQDNISLSLIPAAGHAPFISHPEEFNQILQNII